MNFNWQQICKEIQTADPTIQCEVVWDPLNGEVFIARDKLRTAVKQWAISTGQFTPETIVNQVIDYWCARRAIHPESYLTCACHAHVNPIARSWHNAPTPEPKSPICPCGIDRRDCDYHK
jgi:hypothetical protein